MELLTLCRSCMVEVASWELQNFDVNAMEMFTFCTNIEVSKDDKLPKQFCCDCQIKIESSYTFIKKAQEINEILNTMLLSSETTVIVKSEILTDDLQLYSESNSLEPDSEFSFKVQIDKNNKKLSPNSNQSIEYKMEFDVYQNSPENSDNELDGPLSKKVFDVPEIKFDSNRDELNNLIDDGHVEKKSIISKNRSNCTNKNKIHNKNKKDVIKSRKGVPALVISSKRHNTRTRTRKSHEVKNIEKGNEKSNTEEKFFECDICKQRFKHKKVLQKHMINKHLKSKEKKDGDRPKVEDKKAHNTYYPDVKTCDICDRTFKSSTWFSRHMKEHTDAKQYFCKYCPKTFYSRHAYEYHTRQHSESRRFVCSECGARFKLGKQLAAHALAQAHARLHVCTKCGAAFKTKKDLDSHMNSHVDERPFLCHTCGFSTKFAETLNNHILIHTGEKPYACTQCAFRTSAPSSMRRHARRHRGERPHACPHCEKRFLARGCMMKEFKGMATVSYRMHVGGHHEYGTEQKWSNTDNSLRTTQTTWSKDHPKASDIALESIESTGDQQFNIPSEAQNHLLIKQFIAHK